MSDTLICHPNQLCLSIVKQVTSYGPRCLCDYSNRVHHDRSGHLLIKFCLSVQFDTTGVIKTMIILWAALKSSYSHYWKILLSNCLLMSVFNPLVLISTQYHYFYSHTILAEPQTSIPQCDELCKLCHSLPMIFIVQIRHLQSSHAWLCKSGFDRLDYANYCFQTYCLHSLGPNLSSI